VPARGCATWLAVARLGWPSSPLELILFDLSHHSVPVTEVVGLNVDAEVDEVLTGPSSAPAGPTKTVA
jgi:hypothetical protein